jgi:threonine dehydratase
MAAPENKMNPSRPDIDTIRAAAQRLLGHAVRTPLLESPLLNDRLGGRLLVKPECLQLTGSFKFRGAFNKISQIPQGQAQKGVIAYSSGNHAQGVAAAAHMRAIPAVIVMPSDSPRIKLENTRAWGAEVVTFDRHGEDREAIARKLCEERGLTLIPPYDDPDIIAGQGTVGLEIVEQCGERDIVPDAVTICCGGGGLSSGSAIAIADHFTSCALHTAEPEGWDDTARSLASGQRVILNETPASICDALLAPTPGQQTFAINRDLMTSGTVVTEQEVIDAMATALAMFKIVAEPGGAVALASALSGHVPVSGRTVVAVVSGGNVDPELYRELLARAS